MQIQKDEEIGSGSFGTTFRGTFNGAKVAIKSVYVCKETDKLFIRELQGLSAVRHKNIITLVG